MDNSKFPSMHNDQPCQAYQKAEKVKAHLLHRLHALLGSSAPVLDHEQGQGHHKAARELCCALGRQSLEQQLEDLQ